MADEHIPENRTALRRFYRQSGLRHLLRRRRNALVYQAARTVLPPLRAASLPDALAFADRAADLAYRALPGIRRLALEHLAIAFGETHPPAAREAIAREAYRNTARSVVELAKLDVIRPRFDDYVSVEGLEHFDTARALGRGAIVVTGHIGNCDLLAAYMAHKGIAFAAVARRLDDPRLNQLVVDFRAGYGARVIMRDSPEAGREILRVLKQRGIFAVQLDMDIRVPSVTVPFFGRLARTPAAAAILAVRRDIPAIPAFAQRRPDGGHHFTIMAPILPPRTGDRQRDIIELTHRFSRIIEDRIRQQPSEWNWWHRRWRRPPLPRLDPDAPIPPQRRAADQRQDTPDTPAALPDPLWHPPGASGHSADHPESRAGATRALRGFRIGRLPVILRSRPSAATTDPHTAGARRRRKKRARPEPTGDPQSQQASRE